MNIDDLLLNTTIRIDTYNIDDDGTMTDAGGGTAFYYGFKHNKQTNSSIICLVTNKHVVKGFQYGRFSIKTCDEKGNYLIGSDVPFNVENFEDKWIMHPNENIDLCILPVKTFLESIKNEKKIPFFTAYTIDETISYFEILNLSNIEELFFIGYPDLIIDNHNNVPIVRRCVTATSIKKDFNGKSEFLIDAPVYGGSSGSPVIYYKDGAHFEKNSITDATKLKLVGIVSGSLKHSINNEIKVKETPSGYEVDDGSYIQNNLGIVIQVNELLKFDFLL